MEIATHQTLTAESTSSFSKDLSKLPNVQLGSPDTSPSEDIGDALRGSLGGARDDEELKDLTIVKEYRTDLNGSFFDRLLSPASERSTPGQLRSNRFRRNATPDLAPSLNSNSSEDIEPTDIDYQSLPSPPEPVGVGYVDSEFGFNVQCAYDISVMRHNFRLHKYGEYALKYKRGFTPSPLRRAYTEQQEELVRLDELHTTDSEPSSPDPTHRAYLARQEEFMRLAKSRTIDSEPSSPSAHPACLNGEAKHQLSETFHASGTTSRRHIIQRSSEEHLSREAQVSPPQVSWPAFSDVAVEQEDSALHAIGNQGVDQKAGSKRRRDDMDDGLKQEVLLDAVSQSVKERQFKRVKREP